MIGYVTIGTDDFDKALPFYDGVFEAIELVEVLSPR